MAELVANLAAVRGRRAQWSCRIPAWLHSALAWCAEVNAARKQRVPHTTVQESRMAGLFWFYSSERATAELGHRPRPLRITLLDTHEWACQFGRLKPIQRQQPDHKEQPLRSAA